MKIKKAREKKKNNLIWVLKITILAFIISLIFSLISETIIPNVNIFVGVLIVIIVIGLGILFDMIGIAVTTANERPFHSMSAKKIKSAKVAVILKKNAAKVSSFCNDVIGDICGIISGSAGAIIAASLADILEINTFYITLIVMALIAALTIGGKALGKGVALSKNEIILKRFSKFISLVYNPK